MTNHYYKSLLDRNPFLNGIGLLMMRLFLLSGLLAAGFSVDAQSPGGVPVASWWRADAAATVFSDAGTTPASDSAALYQWNDYTGHGYNLVQANAGNRPIYSNAKMQANFNPTVTFTSDYMSYTPPVNTKIIDRTNGALYAAGYMNVKTGAGFFGFDASNDFPGLHTYILGPDYRLLFYTRTATAYTGLSDSAFQAKYYFTAGAWWQNGLGATSAYVKAKVSLNGNRHIYSGNEMYNVDLNTAYDDIRIGWDTNWGALDGQLNEMMIYEDTLTSEQMDQVESYLAIKYGSTYGYGLRDYKSSDGTVVWSAANNSGNNHNIAGIARDDNGALYQKQSWSTNPGQQVLVSTTGLANTNAANTGTLADGQYLVWGDNGLAKAPTVATTTITGMNFRFASVWKVQNTGSVGTVRIAWPQNTAYQSFSLVQSTDPAFASGNTVTDMTANTITVNGVVYNYADVALADGQYFTFAVYLSTPGGITLPAVWYKPDNVTSSTWLDASVSQLTLTNQNESGTVNPGDQAHNFHKWTTGYSATSYYNFIDPNAVNTNNEVNPVFGNYNTEGLGYMPITIFGVARPTATANGLITGIDNELANGAEPGLAVYPNSGNVSPRFYRFSNGIDKVATSLVSQLDQSAVYYTHPFPGNSTAGSGNLVIGFNGYDTTIAGQNGRSSVAGPYLKIGYSAYGFGAFQGDIQEVIWYKTSLTGIEKQKVETYLSLKFGTTLAHNYVSAAGGTIFDLATNAGYTNNIAGIGNEPANGGLYQKQSNSTNQGKQVLIGVGDLANTNAANTGALTDGQYLIWGDNGLNKSPSIAETNIPGTNFRFAAVWKVQNTGNVGTIRIAWPAGLTNLKLVQNSDPAFAAGNTVTDMSGNTKVIDGITYNYADVTLTDGQYFTFAASVQAPGGVVNGLLMWHKANDGVTTAGPKDIWQDVSGNGRDVTQNNNAAYEPALVTNSTDSADGKVYFFNFNPFYHFDGSNDFFYRSNDNYFPSNTSAGSTYGVMYNSAIGGYRTPYGWGDDDPNFERNGDNFQVWRDNGNVINENLGATDFTAHIGGMNWQGEGANGVYMNINGQVYSANTPIGSIDNNFAIGSEGFDLAGDGNEVFQGGIAEVFAYSIDYHDEPGDAQQRINSYLAIKYGITLSNDDGAAVPDYLSSTSRVVWNATDNSGYNHDIAGIANDYNSALVQNQSMSGNPGKQVLIGTTGLTNTNATNSTSLSDGQFLLWGDNGLGKSPSVYMDNDFSNVNVRFAAIWKVDNTGNVGAVRVAWPTSGYNGFSLIQSNDPTFGTGDAVTSMNNTITIDGIQYNYADVTLSDGQYFTFAIKMEHAPGGVFEGLSLWYRADKLTDTTATGAINSWTDYAMNVNAGQMGTNDYPLYHYGSASYFNFNPGVNFTDGGQSIGNIQYQSISNTDFDIFTVTKEGLTAGGANARVFSILADKAHPSGSIHYWDGIGINYDGRLERYNITSGLAYLANPGNVGFATNNPSIMYHTYTDNTVSKGLNGAENGADGNSGPYGIPNGGFTFGSTVFSSNGSDNYSIEGNLGETIIYGGKNLTAEQRNRVDAYLAIKYGVTLDIASSYLTSQSTVVWDKNDDQDFYHNVAGIARDTVSALYQKQSRSQMPDANGQVTVGLGDIYATNIANPGTLNDGQFLMWGDNGKTVAMSNTAGTYKTFTYNGSSENRRMTRVWKVRNTNMPDSIKIRFPQASVGTTTITGEGTNTSYAIIFSIDSTFDKDITITPLAVNGDDYDVMASFPDGISYFTYGKVLDTTPPPDLCTGKIYLSQDKPTTLREVDITSDPFTYPPIGSATATYNAIGINPKDGYIYGMQYADGLPNYLYKIDPRDGSVTNLGTITGLSNEYMNAGGFDSAGYYYVKPKGQNSTLYKIDIATLSATSISLSTNIGVSDIVYNIKDSLFYTVGADGALITINPVTGAVSTVGPSPGSGVFGAMFSSASGAIYGVRNSGGFYQYNTSTGQRVLLSSAPASDNNDGAHCVDAPLRFQSDLYVTKTTTDTGYYQDSTVTYTIKAGNNGTFGTLLGHVVDSVPTGIPDTNITYTAVASSGSSTSVVGTQTGYIDDYINLPQGGTVTYTVSIVIPSGFTGDLENIVNITPSDNTLDTTMTNNSDTVTLQEVIRSGISGAVFNDVDGLSDNEVDGDSLSSVSDLYIVLADNNTDTVVAVDEVSAVRGSYGFSNVADGDYYIILTTAHPAVGDAAPAADLPAGWINTGEHLGSGTGSDGIVDGKLNVSFSGSDISDANFGIKFMRPATVNPDLMNRGNGY